MLLRRVRSTGLTNGPSWSSRSSGGEAYWRVRLLYRIAPPGREAAHRGLKLGTLEIIVTTVTIVTDIGVPTGIAMKHGRLTQRIEAELGALR